MYQIGVDIGGTFTDCVLIGTDGRGTGAYASAKALSTKDDPVDGVIAGLEKLAANVGLSVGQRPSIPSQAYCITVRSPQERAGAVSRSPGRIRRAGGGCALRRCRRSTVRTRS